MTDILSSYEQGLKALLERLGIEHPRFTEALTLQSRLLENTSGVRTFGDSETSRVERARILHSLDRLTLDELACPFEQLYGQSSRPLALQLPLRISSDTSDYFVGRIKELRSLRRALTEKQPRIVALCGMGGIGKTTLARKIANELADTFPGGVLWADFPAHEGDPLPIMYSWAQVFNRPEVGAIVSQQIRAQAVAHVISEHVEQHGSVLAVFDDVRETVTDRWLLGAQLLKQAIPDNVPMIVTTRQIEVAQSLRARVVVLDVLDTVNSVTMLMRLLPEMEIDPDIAIELVDYVGNLPLATEVMAGLIQVEGIDWVYHRITDQYARLHSLRAGDLRSKADNVLLSLELSYSALPDLLKDVFRLLGVFASGVIRQQWVAGVLDRVADEREPYHDDQVEELLTGLFHRGLLHKTQSGYRLHPLLKDLARSMLIDHTKVEEIHLAHEHYFLILATEQNADFQKISEAFENIRMAASYAFAQGHFDEVVRFVLQVAVFGKYLYTRGLWQDALVLLDLGVKASVAESDALTEARLVWEIGTLQRELGEYDKALSCFDRAIALSKKVEDNYVLASALMGKGYVLLYSSRYGDAQQCLNEALAMAERSQNRMALGEALRGLGRVELSTGKLDTALSYLHQSETILSEAQDWQGLAYNYRALGEIYSLRAHSHEALKYLQRGLDLAKGIGDPQAQAYILRGIGDTYRLSGQLELALKNYRDSEALYRTVGDRAALAGTVCSIGETNYLQGDLASALARFGESGALAAEIDLPRWQARSLFGQAQVFQSRGDLQEALQLCEQALELLRAVGHRDQLLIEEWLGSLHESGGINDSRPKSTSL